MLFLSITLKKLKFLWADNVHNTNKWSIKKLHGQQCHNTGRLCNNDEMLFLPIGSPVNNKCLAHNLDMWYVGVMVCLIRFNLASECLYSGSVFLAELELSVVP